LALIELEDFPCEFYLLVLRDAAQIDVGLLFKDPALGLELYLGRGIGFMESVI
jgi:hypothetical protein